MRLFSGSTEESDNTISDVFRFSSDKRGRPLRERNAFLRNKFRLAKHREATERSLIKAYFVFELSPDI